MTIENTDVLLVNRGTDSYKIKYEKIKDDIKSEVDQFPEANQDGKQYGRQDGNWTEIVHTTPYTDADVDAHLRLDVGADSSGKVLSYDGSKYVWITDQTGDGASTADKISYQYPGGISRSVQNRLEDYLSVADFGAIGDGVGVMHSNGTMGHIDAIRACIDACPIGGSVYFPAGTYIINGGITIEKPIRLFGDGPGTVLLSKPNNQPSLGGPLTLRYNSSVTDNDPGNAYFTIQDLNLYIATGFTAAWGIRLEYYGANGVIGAFNKLVINNVDIGSDPDFSLNGYFKRGIWMQNSSGLVANNLNIYTNQTASEEDPECYGIYVSNTMDNHNLIRTMSITNVYIQRYYRGIKTEVFGTGSSSIESIYVSQGEFVGNSAFDFQRTSAIYLSGLHMDNRSFAIRTDSTNIMRIVGCDIRNGRDQYPGETDFTVKLDNAKDVNITGCWLTAQTPTTGIIETGLAGNAENICITGCNFTGNDSPTFHAIRCQGNSQNITFGGNTLSRFGNNNSPWDDNSGQLYIFGQRS